MKTAEEHSRSDSHASELSIRRPSIDDGWAIYELVKRCPPLDVNTSYCYYLVATHFAQTSSVATLEGEDGLVGLVSGYRIPESPDTLFVWQVAVDSRARGRKLAKRLILAILEREGNEDIRYVHTTVSPSNEPSRRLFASVARSLECPIETGEFLREDHFPGAGHEAEPLVRIGPFKTESK